jgi:hypothetical protein
LRKLRSIGILEIAIFSKQIERAFEEIFQNSQPNKFNHTHLRLDEPVHFLEDLAHVRTMRELNKMTDCFGTSFSSVFPKTKFSTFIARGLSYGTKAVHNTEFVYWIGHHDAVGIEPGTRRVTVSEELGLLTHVRDSDYTYDPDTVESVRDWFFDLEYALFFAKTVSKMTTTSLKKIGLY